MEPGRQKVGQDLATEQQQQEPRVLFFPGGCDITSRQLPKEKATRSEMQTGSFGMASRARQDGTGGPQALWSDRIQQFLSGQQELSVTEGTPGRDERQP